MKWASNACLSVLETDGYSLICQSYLSAYTAIYEEVSTP
jgi:hypothetical protein